MHYKYSNRIILILQKRYTKNCYKYKKYMFINVLCLLLRILRYVFLNKYINIRILMYTMLLCYDNFV